jgi:quercetin dioxygenase-like cupin family protein
MTVEAIVLSAGQGRALELRGSGVTFKAAGARPSGGPTFLEFTVAVGFNTGDHVHSRIEEIFYVVEGVVQIRVGDQLIQANAGDFVLVPPGVAHGFSSSGHRPAKMVLVISPAGMHEQYFVELSALLGKPGAPDADAIRALRERFDTTQVSPLTTS